MREKLTLIIFSFLFCAAVFGQNIDTLKILPGDGHLDGSKLKPYTNKWEVTITMPDGTIKDYRIWTDYLQPMKLNGKEYFHRVQDLYDTKGNFVDTWTNMFESKTLIPYMTYTDDHKGKFSFFEFHGNKVSGRKSNKTDSGYETVEISEELAIPVFDWAMYGMLLVGLPKEEGLIAKIPYYHGSTGEGEGSGWITFTVEGKEMTTAIDKQIETWVVSTSDNLRFNLIDEPPYIIELKYTLQNGAILHWVMID